MPRSGGVYTLPAGNPVVTLTTISSAWANTTMSDIATALTGSLPVDGSAAMTGSLDLADGTVGLPGLDWASESTSGWYRIGLNDFGFSIAGVLMLELEKTVVNVFASPLTGAATFFVQNTSTVSGDQARVVVGSGTTSVAIYAANQNQSGILVSNGPTAAQTVVRNLGAYPLVFGIQNNLVGYFDGTTGNLNLTTTGTSVGTAITGFGPVYAGIPQNSQAGGTYTLVLADANKHIYTATTAPAITIPSNAAVPFPIGTVISGVNRATAGTLAITTDSLLFCPSGTTGTRNLAQFAQWNILKIDATRWALTGVGIT